MKVTTERLEDCQVNVFVELDAAEVDKRLRQTARQISRQFTVPGYRKGKAPLAAVMRTFGREAIQQQAIEDFGQELYDMALEEIEYQPFQPGELEDVEWDPFRMIIRLPIPPEIELGDYRSVRVPYEVEAVTDEDVEKYLVNVQKENAQWVPVERPAEFGDQVVVDMEGRAGDELVMSNEGHEMVVEDGAAYPLPGFHEEIVGMSPGEEKTFVLTVPEDDEDEDAAGREMTVVAHLHSVKAEELPSMDDELALLVGDYDSLEDLRVGAREQMETEALQKAESEYLDKVLDAFIESANTLEYPPQAVDREVEMALGQMESSLASSGLQLDVYLGMIGTTREAYGQELRPVAETRLKRRLVLAEIVEQEGLEADQEEIDAEVERMLESMGPEVGEMRETLSSPGSRALLANDVVTSKAQELAVQIAKGEAPPVEEDEPEEAEVEGEAEVVEVEEEDAEAETETKVEDLAEEPEVEPEAPVEEPVSEEPEDEDEGDEGE